MAFFRTSAQLVHTFIEREDGPTAVEYAVMLSALIIVVCVTAVTALGTNTKASYNKVSTTLASVAGS